jgi:hypothetical protein
MSDSPKDDHKSVPIYNKATGTVSEGEFRGKQPRKEETQPEEATSPATPAHASSDDAQQSLTENPSASGSDQPAVAGQTKTSVNPKGSKSISRVYDIIKRFYASSGALKRIAEPTLKKLEERNLSAAQRSELLDLARREDASLARTFNLAFAAFEIHSNRTIKDLLLKFAVDAGRENFDLAMEDTDAWLPLWEDQRLPIKDLLRRYATIAKQIDVPKDVPVKEKKERLAKLRNLLFLNLIWQANQGWAKEDEILRFLRADEVFTTRTHYPSQAVESLLKGAYSQSTADFSALGWLSRQIENTKASQSSELERLKRDVEQLTAERTRAQEEIDALRHERDTLLGKTGELEQALQQEKQSAQTTIVHMEDDKHRLRSQVSKALKSEVPRLEEALIALQRDPPKLHIVWPYVEETLEHLKKILRDTEGE